MIRNVPVCVVGGAGFLGSHLVNHLVEDRGCQVLVIDNLCAGREGFIHPKATHINHDITAEPAAFLDYLLRTWEIRYLFNYAAYPYIPDCYDNPARVVQVNFAGAMTLLNACHALDIPCLQVSSAELYGDELSHRSHDSWGCIKEEAPVTPRSTYGASKAAIDFYVQARWREARAKAVSLRQFNCVGERETHPYVIPEIITQLSRYDQAHKSDELPEVVLGNNSERDFMYAGDAVRYAVELLEAGHYGEVFNLGSEESVRIYDLPQMIGRLMGLGPVVVRSEESRRRKWEIWKLRSSNTKINACVKYRPKTSLQAALRRTLADFEMRGRKWCWE